MDAETVWDFGTGTLGERQTVFHIGEEWICRWLNRPSVSEPTGCLLISVPSSMVPGPLVFGPAQPNMDSISQFILLLYGFLTKFWPTVLKQKCCNETSIKTMHVCSFPPLHPFLYPAAMLLITSLDHENSPFFSNWLSFIIFYNWKKQHVKLQWLAFWQHCAR